MLILVNKLPRSAAFFFPAYFFHRSLTWRCHWSLHYIVLLNQHTCWCVCWSGYVAIYQDWHVMTPGDVLQIWDFHYLHGSRLNLLKCCFFYNEPNQHQMESDLDNIFWRSVVIDSYTIDLRWHPVTSCLPPLGELYIPTKKLVLLALHHVTEFCVNRSTYNKNPDNINFTLSKVQAGEFIISLYVYKFDSLNLIWTAGIIKDWMYEGN